MMRHALSDVVIQKIGGSTIATLALLAMSAIHHLHADEIFPYTAFVNVNELAVRSGPGKEFYETERIPNGTAVEVYRHVDSGWCAIRPTTGSFSWVAAEHLEIMDNPSLARVINVPAKTRVGSKFGDIHDVEYVSLREGELVELLGTKVLEEASGEQPRRWFKIAPPSGEFRWLHAKGLSRTVPVKDVPGKRVEHDETDAGNEVGGSGAATPIKTHPLTSDTTSEVSSDFEEESGFSRVESEVQQIAFEEPAGNAKRVEEPATDNSTHLNAVTWKAVGTPTDILTAPEPRSFLDRYNALNVLLSRAVLEDTRMWDFRDVRDQTTLLMETAHSQDERRMAEALLAKIDEFQSLKRRHDELSKPPVVKQTSATGKEPAHLEEPAELPKLSDEPIANIQTDMPRIVRQERPKSIAADETDLQHRDAIDNSVFDATGVLISIRAPRKDMPRYALADSNGQIQRFVSTSNGDALSSFLNKRVGIIGKAGFLRRFNKPHVVASKVVQLKR